MKKILLSLTFCSFLLILLSGCGRKNALSLPNASEAEISTSKKQPQKTHKQFFLDSLL